MTEANLNAEAVIIESARSAVDPDACRFTVNRMVYAGGPVLFESPAEAHGSPLAERLLALPGVTYVMVAGNLVEVGKDGNASWDVLQPDVGAVIQAQLDTGIPSVSDAVLPPGAQPRSDQEIHELVEALLDDRINPTIAAHGGRVSVVAVRDRSVYFTMTGGCQGCAASRVTLRAGIEPLVRRAAPEVVDLVDLTDHDAGTDPYFPREDDLEVPVPEKHA
jgi:Fe-S cluster biogenesis protein NfuA